MVIAEPTFPPFQPKPHPEPNLNHNFNPNIYPNKAVVNERQWSIPATKEGNVCRSLGYFECASEAGARVSEAIYLLLHGKAVPTYGRAKRDGRDVTSMTL